MATIQSAIEDNFNYIQISSKPLNVFKTRLILQIGEQNKEVSRRNSKTIDKLTYPEFTEEICDFILKTENPKGFRLI